VLLAVMQRERSMQPGPAFVSHGDPSEAAAVHEPGMPVMAPVQTPLAPHSAVWLATSFVPHGWPAAATTSVAHCCVWVLQVSS
jgi:hypothetical protein